MTSADAALSLPAALRDRIRELDGAHPSLVMATVNDQGAPHATHTFFAWEHERPQPSFVVTVLAHSNKFANLTRDSRVGFTIAGDLPDLWLNGHGTAELLEGREAETALSLITAKTPAVRAFTDRLPTRLVRIHVRDLTLTDVRGGTPLRLVYPERGS